MKRFLYNLFPFFYTLEKKRKKLFTPNGLVVFLLMIICISVLNPNESVTYQVFSLLFSMFIVAIASSLIFRFRFSATRILPRFTTVGIKTNYRIIIHNKTNQIQSELKLLENLPDPSFSFEEFLQASEPNEKQRNAFDQYVGYYRWLWLISQHQGAKVKVINLPPLSPLSKTEVVGEITPLRRGIVRLTGMTIARPDPFGFLYACKSIFLPQSLLVLPKIYNLPPLQLPGSRRYQSGGVALASSVGDSEEFRSLREYRPGDSLRKIHWKSWAKLGKPIVKEEQDEFFVRHALILDTFTQVKYSEILEEAIAIAASLACEIQTQESLLDLIFVGNEAYTFTFGRGISHTDKMLEIIASVVACQDKSFASITPVIINQISLLSGCVCILIDWDEDRKKIINYLKNMGIHTLVLIITDESNNLHQLNLESLSDELTNFRVLKLGKIQEGLIAI